jgi:hypothetical protein
VTAAGAALATRLRREILIEMLLSRDGQANIFHSANPKSANLLGVHSLKITNLPIFIINPQIENPQLENPQISFIILHISVLKVVNVFSNVRIIF